MLKVLVVDDEELVRKGIVMQTVWETLGCEVIGEASNGEEGLDAVQKYHPDLIICDIRMPKMDGIQMLTILREQHNNTYVIFLTAYSDFQYAKSAIKLSASDYLLKPFEDDEFEEAIIRIKNKLEQQNDRISRNGEAYTINLTMKPGDKSKYVSEALAYIAKNYADQDISVGKIAESLGLSEGHLSHIFKKETDYTINSYITRYRIRSAMKLLKNCRYKVYEIAEMVGYRDITYFSATFKKFVGMNPSEWQERCQ